MLKTLKLIAILFGIVFLFSGFWDGKSDSQKRAERIKESKETLAYLYKYAPESKKMIKNA